MGVFLCNISKKNGLPKARQIRLGIEGVSERLRKFIYKPLSHDDLVKSAIWLSNNKKSVRWFLIAGLPGETDDDWQELKSAIVDWKKYSIKGVLGLSFTAWQPEPATPLGMMPLDDDYYERFLVFRDWFFTRGWSNRIQLMSPAGPTTRMTSSIHRMGLSENELKSGGSFGPNDRVLYPYKKQRDAAARKLLTK